MAGSPAYGAGCEIMERRRPRRALAARAALDADTNEGDVVRVTGIVHVVGTALVAALLGSRVHGRKLQPNKLLGGRSTQLRDLSQGPR